MTVKPYDALRYFVESESGKPDYLVDLAHYQGNGCCDCPHFWARLEPELSRTPPDFLEPNERTMCKHIKRARNYLASEVIATMVSREIERREPRSEYEAQRLEFLRRPENRICAACKHRFSSDVHHRRGRAGSLLLDERFWSGVCRPCHDRIHAEPAWARSVGLLETWHNTKNI